MRTVVRTLVAGTFLVWVGVVSAEDKSVLAAVDHYEQIRIALSTDTLPNGPTHAEALVPLASTIGGASAKRAAEQLVKAKTLEDARKHFGDLSAVLVPKFQAEGIAGAHAYMCPMKQKPWMQRGDQMENPYFGKAMLNCGAPLDAKGK